MRFFRNLPATIRILLTVIRLGKSTVFWTLLAAAASLFFYALTLCRTVYCGDGGELALAAANLEIAHPPGYPLLTNVGHVWTILLFFLRPILALNLLSALFAAGAAAFLFLAIKRISDSKSTLQRLMYLALALMFALGQTLWSVATGFEVYSLAALLAALIISLLIEFHRSLKLSFFYLGCYLFGLALCNHLSVLSLGPAMLLLIWRHRDRFAFKDYLFALALVILPLSFYAYLYVRAGFDLVLAWYTPHSLAGLKQQVFAETYQTYLATPRLADLAPYLRQLWGLCSAEFVAPLTLLALPGLYCQLRRDRWLAATLLSIVVTNCALNFNYLIPDIAPYYLPSIIIFTIWIAELLHAVALRSRTAARIALGVALVMTAVTAAGNFSRANVSDKTGAEDYAKDLFEYVPSGGLLFCGSDNSMFPALYLRYVEHYRPDCRVYGHLPTLARLRNDLKPDTAVNRWSKFPELLNYAIAHIDKPIVCSREPLYLANDFKTIIPTLQPRGLVYFLDSTATKTPSRLHFDWRNLPRFYDPKEAIMYIVYYLVNAEALLLRGDPQGEDYLKTAADIALGSDNPVLAEALAAYFVSVENLPLARKVITYAITITTVRFDERLRLLTPLAKIHLMGGDIEKGKQTLDQVLEMNPGSSEARFQLLAIEAATATGDQRWKDAIAIYERMLTLSPEQRDVNLQLGLLYWQTGDTARAREMFNICLRDNYKGDEVKKLLEKL
jgi:tetratricopeptide (TPR) repeat protein